MCTYTHSFPGKRFGPVWCIAYCCLFDAEIGELQKKLHIIKKEFADQEKSYYDWRRKHMAQVHRARVEERKAAEEAHQLVPYVRHLKHDKLTNLSMWNTLSLL